MKKYADIEWLNIADLPEEEQEPFSRWLRVSDFYFPHMYEEWKAAPDKVCRECGKGWYSLVDQAEKELATFGVENKHWLQVKEKFGGLRLYFTTDHLSDEVAIKAREAAEKYIKQASSTCEQCGSDQGIQMSTEDHRATICQECNTKLFDGEFKPSKHY
jgi:hypothetical protein